MRSEIPARSTLCTGSSRTGSALDLLARVRTGGRALAIGLLAYLAFAGLGSETLFAAANELPGNAVPGLTVRRSMRAAPHRLIVHPSEVTVAADQTQQFAVTDAQGKPVSVHWNVSGIGCSGEGCGTIDEHGIYLPPRSLPQPRVVTVEGVLASDPNYSVLTEVRLADAVASASVPAAAQRSQALAAPVIDSKIEKQNVVRAAVLPLPKAVASAPAVESRNAIRSGEAPPLPNVISAPPGIASQNGSRSSISHKEERPPLPTAVAAAPSIESRKVARSGELPPLPGAVAATPTVDKTNVSVSQRAATVALPVVVGAAPTVERNNVSSRGEVPQLPRAVNAPPEIAKADVARRVELPPVPKAVTAAPVAENQTIARAAEIPAPTVAPAPPVAASRNVPQKMELQPLTSMLVIVPDTGKKAPRSAPSPKSEAKTETTLPQSRTANSVKSTAPELLASARPPSLPVYSERPQQLASAAPERKPAPASALLPQMQDSSVPAPTPATPTAATSTAAAPTSAIPVAAQHASVTYANGQLKIDAENLTLATVLKMVAEKTGAVIEVPPGAGTERVFDHIGPGRPEDVLASLLNGSAFDFVIVGSPQGAHVPTQVLLTLRGTEAPAPAPAPTLVASDQSSSEPKANSYLWSPSSAPAVSPSPVWTPPASSAPGVTPSGATPEPLSPEAKEQLMRNFTRQIHGQQPQTDPQPQQ